MIGRILGVLGMPALIVGVIWLGAIIYFQQTGMEVSGTDILVWFAGVPLAAVLAWFVGKALYARSKRPPAAAVDAHAPSGTLAVAASDASLSFKLSILSAEINIAAGASASDLLQAMRKGDVRPGLSGHLVDADGMPVKAMQHANLNDAEYLPWVEQWLRAAGDIDNRNAEEGARLLALLHAPLEQALAVLATLPGPQADSASKNPREPLLHPLVTKVFAPPVWREMVTAYVRGQVLHLGGFAFGVVRTDAAHAELQFDALRVADAFCKESTHGYAKSILLIVSCDSLVAQEQVDLLEAQGLLFTSSNQAGVIPGEAAAILVAAPSEAPAGETIPLAHLHRASFGARQKAVNAGGRIDVGLVQELATAALSNAQLETSVVAGLISDCDHRSAWLTESAMLVSTTFSELDPVADHISIGNALGSTGHASSTLALALAAHAVAMDEKPFLAASLIDPRARSIAALSPWQAPAIFSDIKVSNLSRS
jgi:hypothetical protein